MIGLNCKVEYSTSFITIAHFTWGKHGVWGGGHRISHVVCFWLLPEGQNFEFFIFSMEVLAVKGIFRRLNIEYTTFSGVWLFLVQLREMIFVLDGWVQVQLDSHSINIVLAFMSQPHQKEPGEKQYSYKLPEILCLNQSGCFYPMLSYLSLSLNLYAKIFSLK